MHRYEDLNVNIVINLFNLHSNLNFNIPNKHDCTDIIDFNKFKYKWQT